MRAIGYARELLATGDATADVKALRRAGATTVHLDPHSAGTRARPELEKCLASLQAGDTLLIPSAVALSPTVDHFLTTVAQLRHRGIAVRSLAEPALSAPPDPSVRAEDVLAALDGVRRRLVSLRTRSGLEAAVAAGRRPGRPRVMTEERLAIARELRTQKRSFAQIGRALGVSEAAVRRALAPVAAHPSGE